MKLAALVVALALAVPGMAAAQDAPPDPAKVEEAKRHYAEGKKHHDAGKYDEAAAEYGRAYDIYPTPVLLYNIAQVKRLGGHKQEALEHYEKYLELEPTGAGADNAREFIATLRKEIAAGKPVGKPIERPDEQGGALPPEPPAPPVGPLDTTPPRDPARGRGKRIGGMVVGGLGLVAIGVGVKFALDARGFSQDTEEIDGVWDPAQEQIWNDGEAAERNALIATGVGAAAVVGGIVLYTLGARDRRRAEGTAARPPTTGRIEDFAVLPVAFGADGAGAVINGRF